MAPAGAEPHAPQQQPTEQSGEGAVQVVTVRAGESCGHDPIQHGSGARRLVLGKGPGLHPSMYREFVTADDESGAG
ncbi:hypothetical protein GCM10017771_84920 [Streptomyces capitiformicae]|uniref:Uncharacterized protein n=1 Tax=Streptomyces capitiformicae TaxID=2014920 RepID=A0A918ZPA3_9ACTN|nr:hypothetical protein GCM10017771_84920 [Streptomyces capitiformicae]